MIRIDVRYSTLRTLAKADGLSIHYLNLNLILPPLEKMATPYAGVEDPDRATVKRIFCGYGSGWGNGDT